MIKYLRKFFDKLKQRNMEDSIKVQEKVVELNKKKPGDWLAFNGFHALTKFEFGKKDESLTFHPNSGILLKVFINEKTGELRVFPARAFRK